MDFFTVPTLMFGVLYCFFVIDHGRRRTLHLNVTRNPNAHWVALQLRQTWGYEQPQRFLIFDRDAKFNADVVATMKAMRCEPVRTTYRSPWQNGIAERWMKRSARPTEPRYCSEREAFEKVGKKLYTLLSRGPDSSRTQEGHPQRSNSSVCVSERP